MHSLSYKGLVAALALVVLAHGQAPAAQKPEPEKAAAPIERHDAERDLASSEIGRALFLRGFCGENNLTFDEQGRVRGDVKTRDWTLAGINVLKVSRKSASEVELDGVRVAIRFAADRREFDRHPLNDDKMKVIVQDTGDAKVFRRALEAVFAEGIDRPLQKAMPQYWQHYFDPLLGWPQDALSGQMIYNPGAPGTPAGLTEASATKKAEAGYTGEASRDHVTGTTAVRLVVDPAGEARRVTVVQPLGYGLDERAVEAVAKYHLTPATLAGKAVPSYVVVRQEFVVVATPQ